MTGIITETTGLIAAFVPSWHPSSTVVTGTFPCGRADVLLGESTASGVGAGGFLTGLGDFGLRRVVTGSRTGRPVNGSGVSVEFEPALDRGEPMAAHAVATRRRYGASGECPRRIPA
ncbi:hypothetical protein [Nocardiopsis sp. ATB16-24]|uniref:hypothetical protein n=1 Tax=Nocardiopsis sp. ATB16-24 TaxID=3019555 RepID=UPI002555EF97|nr:hypothetical protein [Nocardiopsis sp. ATB16-24]